MWKLATETVFLEEALFALRFHFSRFCLHRANKNAIKNFCKLTVKRITSLLVFFKCNSTELKANRAYFAPTRTTIVTWVFGYRLKVKAIG